MLRYTSSELNAFHRREIHPCSKEYRMHAHDMHEIYYFLSGTGYYYIEGTSYELKPGYILIMRAGEAHQLHISENQPYERMVVQLSPHFLDKIDNGGFFKKLFHDRQLGQHNLYKPDDLNIFLVQACMNEISAGCRLIKDSNLQQALVLTNIAPVLLELYRSFITPANQEFIAADDISQIVAFINENLTQDFNLDMLAEEFFISKSHLNNKFKKFTGSTIWKYTCIKRLMLAKQLIQQGLSPSEAAANCGWKDYSSFYRKYKSYYGVSPSQV